MWMSVGHHNPRQGDLFPYGLTAHIGIVCKFSIHETRLLTALRAKHVVNYFLIVKRCQKVHVTAPSISN